MPEYYDRSYPREEDVLPPQAPRSLLLPSAMKRERLEEWSLSKTLG